MNLNLDTHEEEQVEAIKRWWRENGIAVVVGLSLGIAVILGWRWYQTYLAGQAEGASALYAAMMSEVEAGKHDRAGTIAQQLLSSHPGTQYADLAQLALAGQQVTAGKLDEASASLQQVIDQGQQEQTQQLARLRLARIQLSRGEYDATLATLDKISLEAYQNAVEELRGDVHLARGEKDLARAAYEKVLAAKNLDGMRQSWVQTKLDNLGTSQAESVPIPANWQPLPAFGETTTQTSVLWHSRGFA